MTVALIVETLVIWYLSSLQDLIIIITKYVSLAKIMKFDDMYAYNMDEFVIKNFTGKKLKTVFRRWYLFQNMDNNNEI